LVIHSRAMGSTSTNHADGPVGIDNVNDWLMDRLTMIDINGIDGETAYWTICLIRCHAEQDSGSWEGPSVSGKLSWSAAGSSAASAPVSFNRIGIPNIMRNVM
jgi:hypothetical protein